MEYTEKNARYVTEITGRPDITLITLGPLTNVAQALLKEPRLKDRIPEIYLMGGSVTAGNYSAVAEFNIYVDAEAAKIVFESGIPIKMVGLNLTRQNLMTQEGRTCLCDACTVVWLIAPGMITKSLPMHVAVFH